MYHLLQKDREKDCFAAKSLALSTRHSPVKVLNILKSIGLLKATGYFQSKFTPAIPLPPEQDLEVSQGGEWEEEEEDDVFFPLDGSAETSEKSSASGKARLCLIGESVKKLSLHMVELVLCLKPPGIWPDQNQESDLEL
jgi:hypothetical protein